MSNLDKIFKEKISDLEEPSVGHFKRFHSKLLKQEKKSRLVPFLKVAALFIFVLLSASLYVHLMDRKTTDQQAGIINNEMRETEFYYNNKINNEISNIENMARIGIAPASELLEIKNELTKMDSLYQDLKRDHQANPNDERVLNAINNHYQAKLEIVNTIKTNWENVKQQKLEYHENI